VPLVEVLGHHTQPKHIDQKEGKLFSADEAAHRRAIYKGCGYDDVDLLRPLIGVVNTQNDAALGHVHLDKIAEEVFRENPKAVNDARTDEKAVHFLIPPGRRQLR
jgi:dihydroxyacid dehydratase/phosphogluconate dehydratase